MKIVYMLLLVVVLALAVGYCRAGREVNRTPVRTFDLNRYLGTWYEIARFDFRFERGLDHVQATYERRPDGLILVRNSGREVRTGKRRVAEGKARLTKVPGRLRVSFFWIFYSQYNVLELGEEYEWALVGGRSAKYLWILSRTPELPPETYHHIVQLARARGYDTDRLLVVDQSEE
ncbi:lipocalin family protein [uncultured Alistipes sp.]|jgi:Bacterial lipocalin|uniref:lipocalin family protein n=1 Tax=uncultured Alistipes sp. TaxID=538949 RepID=UPI0025F10626|nr:lipocalin family protein [uncultured Alistipes sp.]